VLILLHIRLSETVQMHEHDSKMLTEGFVYPIKIPNNLLLYMHVSLSVYLRLHATRIINSFEVILFWNASNDLKRFARSDELLSPTVDTNYVLCIHSMLTLMYRISRLYITSFGLSLHPGAAGSRPMHGVLYVSSSLISITAIAVHSPSAARRCVPTKSTQFSEQ